MGQLSAGLGLREGVGERRALGAEDERQLALGREVALGRRGRWCTARPGSARTACSGGRSTPRRSRASSCPLPYGPLPSRLVPGPPSAGATTRHRRVRDRVPANPCFSSIPPNSGFHPSPRSLRAFGREANPMELVTGATGLRGRPADRAAARARAAPVRALARDAGAAARRATAWRSATGDVISGDGLARGARGLRHGLLPGALDGGRGATPTSPPATARAAENFAARRRARPASSAWSTSAGLAPADRPRLAPHRLARRGRGDPAGVGAPARPRCGPRS